MQSKIRSYWPEWCTLGLYSALVAFAIPYHEPWVDEAQAWQLARSLSLPDLFLKFIRYEGSPGLWHFLLWIMNKVHVGYAGLHWISGIIAICGVALLLFKAPLPRYLRLTLPFTYFLLFQYAIVARNYVLVPPLMFLAAIAWKRSPVLLALVLGLLANTALHAAVISGGLAIIYCVEWLRGKSAAPRADWRKIATAAITLSAFYAFAIWTALPPHDLGLARVRGDSRPIVAMAIESLAWAVCQPAILSAAFWFIVIFWFAARRKLLYLLPIVLFAAFSGFAHFAWWHAGLLVPLLVTLLWLTWPEPGNKPAEFERAAKLALAVMIATQISWAAYAIWFDHVNAYSPDPAAASFLKPYVAQDARIAVTYIRQERWRGQAYPEVGIEPYFDHNIFANVPYSFWWWSDNDPTETRYQQMLPTHPRLVLVEAVDSRHIQLNWNDPVFVALAREGYVYRSSFCGAQLQRFEIEGEICHVFFEYPSQSIASTR